MEAVKVNGGEKFFVEDAFGKIYEGTFFAEDIRKFSSNSSNSAAGNAEEAAIAAATSQVRMSTESEVLRESGKAFISACDFNKNLGSSYTPNFAGKIFATF